MQIWIQRKELRLRKKRPVLIVSNNANNNAATTITVIPITSNVKKIYPFEVFLETSETGLIKPSKAQCHQIRTISKNRIINSKPQGQASNLVMVKIKAALKTPFRFKLIIVAKNCLENKINKEKISRRPAIMAKMSNHLLGILN